MKMPSIDILAPQETQNMSRLTPKLIGLASIFALATAPAFARPMEIEDVANQKNASNVIISDAGNIIAYTLSSPRNLITGDKDGASDTHLYVIRDGGEPTKFIGGEGSISSLQFSPDSEHIYFRKKRDGDENTSLYSISLAGGEAKKVYEHAESLGDYDVSPDGSTLYFVGKDKDEDQKKLKDKGFKSYAYEEDLDFNHVWTVDLSDDEAEAEILFQGAHVSSIELSDDGKTLVVAAAPTPLVDDDLMKKRLHILDASTGAQKAMVNNPGKISTYRIAPDNQRIAFRAGTDINDTSNGVLMVANINDGSFKQLTADAPQHIQDIEWLDNDSILALAHRGVESALVAYNVSGAEERTYNTPSNIVARDIDVSANGDVAFYADSPAHPREVFAVRGDATTKLTNHNAWLSEITLAPQTTFTYTARDGRQIEGLLITPIGEKPKDGWPLILTVHGGPEAHYSDGWMTGYSAAGQFGAGDGYAVFYPNYRGSTGRGVAYAKEHQNDYAGAEFNDLVDGVKALASAGVIDEDRVGITGGSYGGYASMWGATALSEHFAASVAFVGISNQISKFGTSDIPNEMHLVHSLKWPWDDADGHWMELLKRSPLFHAGKSTTPTLIMHGENDTRVHPSQSMELYRSMKVRTDTPVRLVFYPGEGHGNRKAAAQLDYSYRLMRWMDTYLADGNSRDKPMPEFDVGIEDKLGMNDKKEDTAED
jgi:dipeptidyl aminopeptidase/acylaminoacyl peptidase